MKRAKAQPASSANPEYLTLVFDYVTPVRASELAVKLLRILVPSIPKLSSATVSAVWDPPSPRTVSNKEPGQDSEPRSKVLSLRKSSASGGVADFLKPLHSLDSPDELNVRFNRPGAREHWRTDYLCELAITNASQDAPGVNPPNNVGFVYSSELRHAVVILTIRTGTYATLSERKRLSLLLRIVKVLDYANPGSGVVTIERGEETLAGAVFDASIDGDFGWRHAIASSVWLNSQTPREKRIRFLGWGVYLGKVLADFVAARSSLVSQFEEFVPSPLAGGVPRKGTQVTRKFKSGGVFLGLSRDPLNASDQGDVDQREKPRFQGAFNMLGYPSVELATWLHIQFRTLGVLA